MFSQATWSRRTRGRTRRGGSSGSTTRTTNPRARVPPRRRRSGTESSSRYTANSTHWWVFNIDQRFVLMFCKVATYRHVYRAKPKEPTRFGSVSGSEIQNLPFLLVVLYLCIGQNLTNQPNFVLYLVRRSKMFVSVTTLMFCFFVRAKSANEKYCSHINGC